MNRKYMFSFLAIFFSLSFVITGPVFADGASADNPASLENAGDFVNLANQAFPGVTQPAGTKPADDTQATTPGPATGTMTREEYRAAVEKANADLGPEGLSQEEIMNIGSVLASARRSYLRGEAARGRGFNRGSGNLNSGFGDEVGNSGVGGGANTVGGDVNSGLTNAPVANKTEHHP